MLNLLNKFLLQWMFLRICKVVNDDGCIENFYLMFVYPLSGYGKKPFKFWNKKKMLKLC